MRHVDGIQKCILLIVLGGLLAGCGGAPDPSGVRSGHWASATSERAGKRLVVAYRDDLRSEQRQGKPVLLIVSWHYLDAEGDGQPTAAQSKTFLAFERQLVPALEQGGLATFVATITFNEQHDWYFFTSTADKAQTLTRAQAIDKPSAALIEIDAESDSTGEFYKKLQERVR